MKRKRLGDYIFEFSKRNKQQLALPVYSVTNDKGFCTEYFSKDVASKDKSTYKIVPKGYFAYNPSRINVGSIDWQNCENEVIVSPLYVVFGVDETINQQYLLYYLKSDIAKTYIKAMAIGSVRDNLKFKTLQDFPIQWRSLEEQSEIVAKLDKVRELIALREEELEKIEALIKSQFIEMFGDIVRNERGWRRESVDQVAPAVQYRGQLDSTDGKFWLLNLDMVEAQTGEIISKVMVDEAEIGTSTTTFGRENVLYSKLRPYLNKVWSIRNLNYK